MTLPSMIDGTQAYYETQRRLSEKAYAQTAGLPDGESALKRFFRRLRESTARRSSTPAPAHAERIEVNRPPVFSK
jgi:hypothetical protein